MGKNRNRSEYSETNNRRVHKILHIRCVTSCCLKCAIRGRRKWYRITGDEDRRTGSKFPSWKLVSKNKKQWMEKSLKLGTKKAFSRSYTTISW